MPDHEQLLIRTAPLLQTTHQLVREFKAGRALDRRCPEKSAMAINETQFLISETDKVIRDSGTNRVLLKSD